MKVLCELEVNGAHHEIALEPSTTLVSYFMTPRKGFAWVVDRDSVELVDVGMSAWDVDTYKVRCFAEEIAAGPWDPRGWKQDYGCTDRPMPDEPGNTWGWS